jgi:hypothetical protein
MAKALSVNVTDWLNKDVPNLARDAMLAAVIREKQRVISEQSQRAGIAPTLETMIVDGQRNASESQIKGASHVTLDWNYLTEAVIRTVDYLRLHGPERSGAWKQSIITLIDGHEQPIDTPIPANAAQAIVVVTVPYSRKLEVGRTESGRPFSIQVPQHFVETACLRLRSEMRDLAKFTFQYTHLSGAHTLTLAGRHRRDFRSGQARRGAIRHGETTVEYPSIRIDELKAL